MSHNIVVTRQVAMYDKYVDVGPFQGFNAGTQDHKPKKVTEMCFCSDKVVS